MKYKYFAFLVVFSILAMLAFLSSSNAAEPTVVLKIGHIPTYHGIRTVWFGNSGNAQVHLSFTAPWDLTNGPKQKKITEILVEKADAFDGNKFPDATFAIERTSGGQKEYRFYKKIKNGVYWLGSSTPPQNPNINNFAFAPAVRLLLLPSKTGLQAVQNSNFVSPEGTFPFTMTVKIIGKGKVIVGAGSFNDAVMVQQKLVLSGDPPFIVYQWYAPFVGRVAEIRSLDGETNELFTTASEFTWMKSCAMP